VPECMHVEFKSNRGQCVSLQPVEHGTESKRLHTGIPTNRVEERHECVMLHYIKNLCENKDGKCGKEQVRRRTHSHRLTLTAAGVPSKTKSEVSPPMQRRA
jgi:hypothetical protein